MNEAALLAARANKKLVEMADFEKAKDKVLMGVERKSLVISAKERRITAYHEAGHALVAKLLPGTDPIHKVTIIPRGRALGVTQQLPTEDKHNYSKSTCSTTSPSSTAGGWPRSSSSGAGDHHRGHERHRAGHRAGPQDGLRVGHERERWALSSSASGRR